VYTVRPLSVEDRSDFRQLRQLALTVDPDDFMITAEEERMVERLFIEGVLERPGTCSLFMGAFAVDAPRLVGIAGLLTNEFLKTRHSGRITSLFVHPSHRRRGIARRLMEELLARAQLGGLRSVRLEVVADNQNAIALYRSLGFTVYGREPAAYRLGEREWDLLLFTKDLRLSPQIPILQDRFIR
jgi:ribosomal protein S18 acetylase RimI-like enzyme